MKLAFGHLELRAPRFLITCIVFNVLGVILVFLYPDQIQRPERCTISGSKSVSMSRNSYPHLFHANQDPDPGFQLFADAEPNPDPGLEIFAVPDPDPWLYCFPKFVLFM